MDKRKLNNEIVLCRAAVRKAKVAVIRRLLKNMKILKSCKVEAVKEKKLRKAERLFEKVQVMKKVKDDVVTKFALRYADVEVFLQGPKCHIIKSALAHLAKHKAVASKVNSIREQFQDWESELPPLLDTLGKKKKKMVNMKEIVNTNFMGTTLNGGKSKNANLKVKREDGTDGEVKKSKNAIVKVKREDDSDGEVKKSKNAIVKVKMEVDTDEEVNPNANVKVKREDDSDGEVKKSKNTNVKIKREAGTDGKVKTNVGEVKVRQDRKMGKGEEQSLRGNSEGGRTIKVEKAETIKKIEDPFFIGKQIVAPKLVLESELNKKTSNKFEKSELPAWGRENRNSGFHSKGSRGRNSSEWRREKPLPAPEEEKLHPSWAAKKVKLIKPFQGKKITFSED